MNKINKNLLYLISIALLITTTTQNAFAFDLFKLDDGDLMNKFFFDPLFGEQGTMGKLFEILNAGVLMIAGVLFIYNALIMAERSAATPDKITNGRWFWIRMPVAVALMMPVSNGMSSIQEVVIWSAKQGVGLATDLYKEVADSSFDSALYIPPNLQGKVEKISYNLFINNVCINAFNKDMTKESMSTMFPDIVQSGYFSINTVKTGSAYILDYSLKNKMRNNVWDTNPMYQPFFCGKASISINNYDNKLASITEAGKMLNVNSALKQLQPEQQKNFVTLQNEMSELAQKFIDGKETEASIYKSIQDSAQKYNNNMASAANASFKSSVNPSYIENMKKDGIAMLGAYPMQIAAAADQVTTALTQLPVVSVSNMDVPKGVMEMMPNSLILLKRAKQYAANGESLSKAGVENIGNSEANSTATGVLLGWFIKDNNLGFDNDAGAIASKNLLLSVKTEGNKFINAAWTALGMGTAFAAAGGAASSNIIANVAGADGAFQALMQMITPLFFALFFTLIGIGITLAVVIPLMVFCTWSMAIIHYVLEVCLAVCAAPFWALSHTVDKGDGLIGTAAKGYLELLSLVSRPPLMVMGAVFSLKLLSAVNAYINEGFAAVFNLSVINDTSGLGVTLFLGSMVVYSMTMLALTKKLISSITIFPDKILLWIGGPHGDMSSPVKDIGATTAASTAAAMGVLKAGSGKGVSTLAQKFGGNKAPLPTKDSGSGSKADNNSKQRED